MIKRTNLRSRTTTLGFAALALAICGVPDQAAAQDQEQTPGVALVNESNEEVRVYAYSGDPEDRVLIGWVGASETDYFEIPDEATSPEGAFTVAVQQVLPLPQIGVSAQPHPLIPSGTLMPEDGATVRLVLDENMALTYDMVP